MVRGDLSEKIARLRTAMALLGHPLIVVETYRTQERQDALYAQGRTKPGAQVTWTKHSMHTDGRAVDLAFSGPEPFNEAHPWGLLKTCAETVGLKGLGVRDHGHWEV